MPNYLSLAPSELLVDVQNPRLPRPNVGQNEAIREMVRELAPKLIVLALNPA